MDEEQEMSLTERQRCWLEQVQACEAAGKTIAEYAVDQGIEVKAMYTGCFHDLTLELPDFIRSPRVPFSLPRRSEWLCDQTKRDSG